jgi:hypothetical protein
MQVFLSILGKNYQKRPKKCFSYKDEYHQEMNKIKILVFADLDFKF